MDEHATIGGLLEAARAQLERLEPTAAQAAVDDGALLIDTRCAELRRETGIVPGSVHQVLVSGDRPAHPRVLRASFTPATQLALTMVIGGTAVTHH
jgi:hypothetical protein